ncbi:metal ion transporter [Aspergillus heteromorphus CBS 117.55]|uniref:Metal ion transporter n=1 Tax=Aspergillus heteromorphus CBS 117.55 TaxID=1448321 RepID=A0A317X3W1_9EURO|nr:metal ion transporter [Aspergillus heteromorphus CBS 117.55]PWY92197.1 metal ion transporter [Aspergillus heteromorphus CBS 117.55]
MNRLVQVLRRPGAKPDIQGVAPTQHLQSESAERITGYVVAPKQRMLDRWLDWVVCASGSRFVFFSILTGLLAWALLGIPYGRTASWQVIISDVQAIVSYIFDSLLVRQLLNGYEDEMVAAAQVQSRLATHARLLRALGQGSSKGSQAGGAASQSVTPDIEELKTPLPKENQFCRYISAVAHILGHPVIIVLFWIGVFVWIGIGSLCEWSDAWQLYMNSASSALMVFVFAFLANVREQRSASSRRTLDAIFTLDSTLELRLRSLTGDTLPNTAVVISAPKVNRVQRAIFYYADFVGTLIGIALLLTVIAVWVAVGPLLHFDSDWWLLIGTYAGLVGMNDAFVLRNMQMRLGSYVSDEFDKIQTDDHRLFETIGLPIPERKTLNDSSIAYQVSKTMGRISAHELTVVVGFVTILGLIAGASAMKWSLTGQLLCNVPPSLLESFFMIILITGDNLMEDRKLVDLQSIYDRRITLLWFVDFLRQQTRDSGRAIEKTTVRTCLSRGVPEELA